MTLTLSVTRTMIMIHAHTINQRQREVGSTDIVETDRRTVVHGRSQYLPLTIIRMLYRNKYLSVIGLHVYITRCQNLTFYLYFTCVLCNCLRCL